MCSSSSSWCGCASELFTLTPSGTWKVWGCGFHWQTYFRRPRVLAGRQFERECCWSPDVLRKYWIWTSGGGEELKAWRSVFGNMAGGGAAVLGAQRGPFLIWQGTQILFLHRWLEERTSITHHALCHSCLPVETAQPSPGSPRKWKPFSGGDLHTAFLGRRLKALT